MALAKRFIGVSCSAVSRSLTTRILDSRQCEAVVGRLADRLPRLPVRAIAEL